LALSLKEAIDIDLWTCGGVSSLLQKSQ